MLSAPHRSRFQNRTKHFIIVDIVLFSIDMTFSVKTRQEMKAKAKEKCITARTDSVLRLQKYFLINCNNFLIPDDDKQKWKQF